MREQMFSVGSLIVAVGSALLLGAIATHLFVGRELTTFETLLAVIGSSIAGFFWWRRSTQMIKKHSSRLSN